MSDHTTDAPTQFHLRRQLTEKFGDDHTVLAVVPVLWAGWESDYEVVILQTADGIQAWGTDHGGLCEWTVPALQEKAAEYQRAIDKTVEAIALLADGTTASG